MGRPTRRLSHGNKFRIPQGTHRTTLRKGKDDGNGAEEEATYHRSIDEEGLPPFTCPHYAQYQEGHRDLTGRQSDNGWRLRYPIDSGGSDGLRWILFQVVQMPATSELS